MRPRWATLNEHDRAAFHAVLAFLNGRLEEKATIEWALRLKSAETIKRSALLELIDSPYGRKIAEPWQSAWRLVEEAWNGPATEDNVSTGTYNVQHRLRAGDRSGSLVAAIVELVVPRLKVEPLSDLHLQIRKAPKRPRKVVDIVSMRLTSGKVVDPGVLGLRDVVEVSFILALANALQAAVFNGLDIARRIGRNGSVRFWQLGQLHRVYYVAVAERAAGEHEPDEFHRGIAPSVKLLHSVIARLVDLDIPAATNFVRGWKTTSSPVHLRLWAALSRDPRITPADEIGAFLLSLDEHCFWNLHDYPEIAELRAMRFGELGTQEQAALTSRIHSRPPRNQWPKEVDADRVEDARLYWAVREMRRIEIAGAILPPYDEDWLRSNIDRFPDLAQMARIDEGFLASPRARFVAPNPDSQYDLLAGEQRLSALETALTTARGNWDDNPAERAGDWIRQASNPTKVLADLESLPNAGAAFPRVWERFGWAHSPTTAQSGEAVQRDLAAEAVRVLALLSRLPRTTASQSIEGISHWVSSWEQHVVLAAEGLGVWLKLWPLSVDATNARQSDKDSGVDEVDLNTAVQPSGDHEPEDLDTLNTPAGKLVGVFLASCPPVRANDSPFADGSAAREMREAVIAATGRSGLIARHRMIESLPYFLRADPDWTHEHLIAPLVAENVEALALWRAIARQTHFSDVLKIIGGPMAERAIDRRLGRETRRSLVFSLVVECLHALKEARAPAVPYSRIQQMIRSLDDEVRGYAAEAIRRFVSEVSAAVQGAPPPPTPESLLRSAAAPFLQQVWPQERSLTTPGVSQALAHLPAASNEAFADAVAAIERFLVPFDCWSMFEYGLSSEGDHEPSLASINSPEKAAAFLRLLGRTIGTSEGSVIPQDLADALDQIRKVSPRLTETQEFRRLATAARRS